MLGTSIFFKSKKTFFQESTVKPTSMTARAIPVIMGPALTRSMATSAPVNLATLVNYRVHSSIDFNI